MNIQLTRHFDLYIGSQRAFTLIEVLVVMSVFILFSTMGLIFSLDSYRGYVFRSEYTKVVTLLLTARSKAINNFNESAQGVAIVDDEYRIFTSNLYEETNKDTYQSLPRSKALVVTGAARIEFEQLSGNCNACRDIPITITFGYGQKTKDININYQGGITW